MLAQQCDSNGRAQCVNAPSLPGVAAIATKIPYIVSGLSFAPIVWRFLDLKTTSSFINCDYTGKRRARKPSYGTYRSRQHLSPQGTLTKHCHPQPISLRSCPSNRGPGGRIFLKGKKNFHTDYVAYHFYVSKWKLFNFIWTYESTRDYTQERDTFGFNRIYFTRKGVSLTPKCVNKS